MCPPLRRDENFPEEEEEVYMQPLDDLVGFQEVGIIQDEAQFFQELGVAFLEASNRLRFEEEPSEEILPPTQPVSPSPTVSPLSQELHRPLSSTSPAMTQPANGDWESPSPPLIYDPFTRSYVQQGNRSPNGMISPTLRCAIYEHIFGRSTPPCLPDETLNESSKESPKGSPSPDYSPVTKRSRFDSDDDDDENDTCRPRKILVPRRLSFSD